MKPPTQFWNLNSPKMCRDFLKQVRIGPGGAQITQLTQADGKVISIDEASDEQVIELCKDFSDALGKRKPK